MDLLITTEDYLMKIKQHMWDWEYQEARQLIQELLEREPDNAHAHGMMGFILGAQLGLLEDSETHLKLAIQFDPNNAFAHEHYMYLLATMDRYEEMVVFAELALKIPAIKRHVIWKFKGEALELLERFSEAQYAFRQVVFTTVDDDAIREAEQSLERIQKKMRWRGAFELTFSYVEGPRHIA